jgi:hypothetical protein
MGGGAPLAVKMIEYRLVVTNIRRRHIMTYVCEVFRARAARSASDIQYAGRSTLEIVQVAVNTAIKSCIDLRRPIPAKKEVSDFLQVGLTAQTKHGRIKKNGVRHVLKSALYIFKNEQAESMKIKMLAQGFCASI